MNLVEFIINHWQDVSLKEFFRGKRVTVNDRNIHYEFCINNENILRTPLDHYKCQHEEADTRILYIRVIAKFESPRNIVVRCNDTYVLVILLANLWKVKCKVWMEMGLYNNNSLRYVDVNGIYSALGEDSFSRGFPCLHGMRHNFRFLQEREEGSDENTWKKFRICAILQEQRHPKRDRRLNKSGWKICVP